MLVTSYLTSSPHDLFAPTPLSPRSTNVHGRYPSRQKLMSGPKPTKTDAFSQRAIKRAPVPTNSTLSSRRRNDYLKKVREAREDKRFEARGEDVLRAEFVRKRRDYEAELERFAPNLVPEEDDEEEKEMESPSWSQPSLRMEPLSSLLSASNQRQQQGDFDEEQAAEEFAQEEEDELLALLENMPPEDDDAMEGGSNVEAENLWSDDTDYDALFDEVMGQENQAPREQVFANDHGEEEMDMDMS